MAEQLPKKNSIQFTNYAVVPLIPGAMRLTDHMVPFEGANNLSTDSFLWGIYGHHASNGLILAEQQARAMQAKVVTLAAAFDIQNFDKVRQLLTHDLVKLTGFMHVDRLKGPLRDDVRSFLLQKAVDRYAGFSVPDYERATVSELLLAHPGLIADLFDFDSAVQMVVVPVRQLYVPEDTRPIFIAVCRRQPDRVSGLSARFLSRVVVTI